MTGKLPEQVKLRTIKGCSPDCDVRLTLHPADTDARQPMSTSQHPADTDARQQSASSSALILIPRILVLGIGCRKGTTYETLESFFQSFMEQNGFAPEGIFTAASVDIKASEPGLAEFCSSHGWPLNTYPASLLQTLEGDFSTSEFVREITGTDNVCERSAVYRSKGTLVCRKTAGNGVTMALAAAPFHPDWEK